MNAADASALGPCPHCGEQHAEDVLVCPKSEKYMPLQGRLLDNKYRFVKLLGEGGMGSVWKARHELVAKDFAIKLMHPEFASNPNILDRFRKEAQAAGRIGSVHICDISDFGKSVLGPYIVMEMMIGQALEGLIKSSGRVEFGLATLIMRQALEGLAAAHDVGIIHRDLKPDNIFLNEPEPGRLLVKLVDFGISKFTEASAGSGKTGVGVLMGTPEYMSPEQAEGAANVDARTDIWAMGAILYQALSGQQPFSGATMAQTLVALSTREPTPLKSMIPDLPDGLVAVVERCLRKNPDERFQSARELQAALAPFEQQGAIIMPAAGAAVHTLAPNSPTPPHSLAPASGGGATVIGGGPSFAGPGSLAGAGGGRTQLSDEQSWSIGVTDERPPSSLGGGRSGGSRIGLIIGLVVALGGAGAAAAIM
ncbi:MAG: serine/threonine protein kinase, partial [Myxococcales bacterium]|nr:serine/threonine protein kinase [Myxococcales bacterium]